MTKFYVSCGLSKNQIYIIKWAVKDKISRQLPILPDPIETTLFFEGRDAWIYNWSLNNKYPIDSKDKISLEVVAKLKKEFHRYNDSTHYKFLCKVQLRKDIYRPKVTITKRNA
jgi:hypothetical protein